MAAPDLRRHLFALLAAVDVGVAVLYPRGRALFAAWGVYMAIVSLMPSDDH
jgi:hypothetical protein